MNWILIVIILAILWVGYRVKKLHEFLIDEFHKFKNPETIGEHWAKEESEKH